MPGQDELGPLTKITTDAELIADLGPFRGKLVVDVGCGTGDMVRWFQGQGARAIGVDTADMVAKARAADPESAASLLIGTGEHLPLADETADVVLFLASFHHVPEALLVTAMRTATRVLRPGGLLIFIEPVVAAGAYTTLTRLVDDEAPILEAAKDAIGRYGDLGLGLVSETHLATERTLADFRHLLQTFIDDKEQRGEYLRQAEEVTQELAAAAGVARETYTYLSICRRTVLRKAPSQEGTRAPCV